MRVGLNAHLLSMDSTYRNAGVSRYIYNLMLHLPLADTSTRFVAYTSLSGARFEGWELRRSVLPTSNPLIRMFWEQFCQPFSARGLDLLHAPVFVTPLLAPCPTVVTLHDLSFLTLPQAFRAGNRKYLQTFTRLSVRKAKRVIAVSENTRRDAALLLSIPPERISVVPNGVDAQFHPINDKNRLVEFRQRAGIPDDFILFVGTLEPRKNLSTLIRAYSQLKESDEIQHKLVVAGSKGWFYGSIFELVEDLGLENDVVFAGYVPSEELPLWYNAATLFAYPSLYEGFGLPPLEAMACGTPVITSNVSSMPEVVGHAGIMVDPMDVQAWADSIRTVLRDPNLRETLASAGLERAERFSWKRTAKLTADLYRGVLNPPAEYHA